MKTSLKTRIADLLNQNNTSEIDSICAELHEEQSNLIAHLDKLTEFGLREYVFKRHSQIDALGKSLYRFKQLSENGLSKEAYQEAQNISRLLSEFAGTVVYKWVAEPNACDRCRSMNGMTYYSLDDIPEKPHPNCKCRLEANTQSASQTFYVNASVYEDKTQETKEEIYKMKTEIEKLDQKAQENLKEVEKQEKLIKEIENKIDVNTLPPEEKRQFDEAKSGIDKLKYEITTDCKILKNLKTLLYSSVSKRKNDIMVILPKIQASLYDSALLINRYNFFTNKIIKMIFNLIGKKHITKHNMLEAYNLYKIASPEFKYNKEYVEQNGYMFGSIKDFPDNKIQVDIRKVLKEEEIAEQIKLRDSKVIFLKDDSTLARAIINSNTFERFLNENRDNLIKNKRIPDTSITFESDDSDLYAAIHGCWFKNIHIDSNQNLQIRVEDLYDFNKRFTSVKAVVGRYLQDTRMLIPFYLIVDLTIPEKKWNNKCDKN